MVIDHARAVDHQEEESCRRQDDRRHRDIRSGKALRGAHQHEYGQPVEQGRPDDLRGAFGGGGAGAQRIEGHDDQREWRVDQPRPVHDEAARGAHPVLMEIEPALAAEQVADLDQPQHAVIVGAIIRKRGEAGNGIDRQHHQRGAQRKQEIVFPTGALHGHAGCYALEQFPEECDTGFRQELRQNKEIGWFAVSGKRRTTLEIFSPSCIIRRNKA
ncbi:hypothetical protein MPLDJ20_50122 [Mesorhizobium plurifarium]|uniref:Uncharacterized protein n=1 Tax=Mesorhizobium plurifarium TaxID=69974 RepID=A0A090FFD8_MESPL|nr:hypothetical protein MPLDJ20_50122 [Mesorhizobium plurifarium]